MFTQEDVDRMIEERVAEERATAERQRLVDEEKWRGEKAALEQAIEEKTTQLTEVQAQVSAFGESAERVGKLETILGTMRDEALKPLPKELVSLLQEKPVEDQLAWLAENGAKFGTSGGALPPTPDGGDSSMKRSFSAVTRL